MCFFLDTAFGRAAPDGEQQSAGDRRRTRCGRRTHLPSRLRRHLIRSLPAPGRHLRTLEQSSLF